MSATFWSALGPSTTTLLSHRRRGWVLVSGTTSFNHITQDLLDAQHSIRASWIICSFSGGYIPSATSTSRLCGTLGFFQWIKLGLYVGVRIRYGSAVVVVVKFEDQVRSALLISSSYTVQAKAELIAFLLMRSATPSISDRIPSSETIFWQAWYMFL